MAARTGAALTENRTNRDTLGPGSRGGDARTRETWECLMSDVDVAAG